MTVDTRPVAGSSQLGKDGQGGVVQTQHESQHDQHHGAGNGYRCEGLAAQEVTDPEAINHLHRCLQQVGRQNWERKDEELAWNRAASEIAIHYGEASPTPAELLDWKAWGIP